MPEDARIERERQAEERRAQSEREREEARFRDRSLGRVLLDFGAASLVVLLAGTLVARGGDALATQTGIGSSFLGVTLVALATSLPELSTTIGAVRLGADDLALSNAFGTNLVKGAVLLLIDAAYRPGAIFATMGRFSLVATLLGILLTCIFLGGLVERRTRRVWRLGIDSALVLAVYAVGLVVLYHAR